MSRRIQIVLPDPAAELLSDRAAGEGLAPSTLAAQLVREGLHSAMTGGISRAPHPPSRSSRSQRPGWLEPYGGSRTWRADTWGAVVALYARYPRALAALKDGWWEDAVNLEMLAALAAWRAHLDAAAADPREELDFHSRLEEYGQQLRAEGGGVTRAWEPGAPPLGWSSMDS